MNNGFYSLGYGLTHQPDASGALYRSANTASAIIRAVALRKKQIALSNIETNLLNNNDNQHDVTNIVSAIKAGVNPRTVVSAFNIGRESRNSQNIYNGSYPVNTTTQLVQGLIGTGQNVNPGSVARAQNTNERTSHIERASTYMKLGENVKANNELILAGLRPIKIPRSSSEIASSQKVHHTYPSLAQQKAFFSHPGTKPYSTVFDKKAWLEWGEFARKLGHGYTLSSMFAYLNSKAASKPTVSNPVNTKGWNGKFVDANGNVAWYKNGKRAPVPDGGH